MKNAAKQALPPVERPHLDQALINIEKILDDVRATADRPQPKTEEVQLAPPVSQLYPVGQALTLPLPGIASAAEFTEREMLAFVCRTLYELRSPIVEEVLKHTSSRAKRIALEQALVIAEIITAQEGTATELDEIEAGKKTELQTLAGC